MHRKKGLSRYVNPLHKIPEISKFAGNIDVMSRHLPCALLMTPVKPYGYEKEL